MEDYEIVYNYLYARNYTSSWSKNEKRVLRRRCTNNFKISKGILYYSAEKGTKDDWRIVVKNDAEKKQKRIMNACHNNPEGKWA